MTPERWRRLNDLFAAALDRRSEEREAFLAEACGEDPALRQEVLALLASDKAAASLEPPAFEVDQAEAPTLLPGTLLGPYEVIALLGTGGMGEVYRARDTRLGRDVAVKVLSRAFSQDEQRLKRFEHEARAASALNHPNVVTIYDVGSTGDLPYVVLELLEGKTLRAHMAAGPFAVAEALRLARDAVAGLVAAHERGIVHRDLKPENLFVTRDGHLKILDFGLAKQMEPRRPDASTATPRTHPGMVLGTVGYMSPEQVRGLPADQRSDIFSFGAVLYEMLTGRRAFPGDSQADALSAILRDEPPPPSTEQPEIPLELDALAERCLRKRPEGRFETARELADALDSVLLALATMPTADRRKRPSPDVDDLYLKGRFHLKRGTLSDLVAAVDWFEKARDAEPRYALAWAGLADTYARMGFTFQPEGDWHARAQVACDRALALDPSLPEGRHVRGLLRWSPQTGFDHAGAIRDFAAAVQGRPSLDDAYRCLAGVLFHVGLLEEAQVELERALALAGDHALADLNLGLLRYLQTRYPEALEITEGVARRAAEPFSFYQIGLCQLRLGRFDEASRNVEVLKLHFRGDVLAQPLLGLMAALRGDAALALTHVDLTVQHRKAFGHYHHAQYDVACIHALIGQADKAIDWLADAAHNGFPCVPFFEGDELLASLRGEERFLHLMGELREESKRYLTLYQDVRRRDALPAAMESLRQRALASRGARIMLAVLPFENLGGDDEQEYFSDGLTEELITQLGRLNAERLAVIARTSAMSYKGARKSVEQIGRELGVAYVLEGSVRGGAGRLRIGAQLVQVRDQAQVWAESYDRELTDVLAVQAELGRAVARQIGVLLTPSARYVPHAVEPAAYLAYLKGRFCWNKRTAEGAQQGIAFFQAALTADPACAAAHAGLADCYALLGDVGIAALRPREAFGRATEAVTRALELDANLAEAHASLAHVRMHEFGWADAEREFERTLELDPNYATACHWYAMFLAAMERPAQAMAMITRARELDPLSPAINTDVGVLLYYAREFDRAIDQHRVTLEMHPEFARAWVTLASARSQKGLHDGAVAAVRKAVALSPDPAKKAALARICAAAGLKEEARAILQELEDLFSRSQVAAFPIALIHAALGNREGAFTWLLEAREESAPEIVFVRVDPWLDELRAEPRFDDLLRSVGLSV